MSTERMVALDVLKIARRFNGPPDSGNGGYVCGEVAKALDVVQPGLLATGVRVRLNQPPSLETALRIETMDAGCGLFDGDALVARAWPDPLEMAVPDPVDFETSTEAARHFRGHDEHVFPTCFVCGPERAEGDGLRIFPGPVPASATSMENVFASPWRPDGSLRITPHQNGSREDPDAVDPAFVWAALDCPGAFSFPQPEGAVILLGEMTAAITGVARVGEPCVLLAWKIEQSGRKHTTGTALYGPNGDCLGRARAMWIEVSDG